MTSSAQLTGAESLPFEGFITAIQQKIHLLRKYYIISDFCTYILFVLTLCIIIVGIIVWLKSTNPFVVKEFIRECWYVATSNTLRTSTS